MSKEDKPFLGSALEPLLPGRVERQVAPRPSASTAVGTPCLCTELLGALMNLFVRREAEHEASVRDI